VLGGVRVRHIDELGQIVQAKRVRIAVVATPAASAQDAAERLVAAGVTSILNFAPVVLAVPRPVEVRKVDLAVELQILSYYEQRRAGVGAPGGGLHAVGVPVGDSGSRHSSTRSPGGAAARGTASA
jgi:redox-sensing transcriptional repressor